MDSYLSLFAGVVLAALGGELFVRGAVGLARWAKVTPAMVAVTVAAFATSSPELSVAINSALAGRPQIALGDSLGSNVVNVALILGTALLISGIRTPRDSLRRDFPAAIVVPLVTVVFVADGELSRLEGLALLLGFLAWLASAVAEARRQRRAWVDDGLKTKHVRALAATGVGLGLLVLAGTLIVAGARGVARSFGLDEFVIGATVVAVGTSVPELATTIMAKLRGHDEVGLGTVLGSNLFNGLLIVAVAALIHPIRIESSEVIVALAFGIAAVALTFPIRDGQLGRVRGALLLTLYAGYLYTILH
jgi:cation:H+ antiporter